MSVTNSVLSQIYRSPCTKSYAAYQILSAGNSQSRRAAQYNASHGISLYNCFALNINICDLLPKNTPYQVCSPWPQFGGLDNTNSRYTPILASQTGTTTLLSVSQNLFQANTSPTIANDGTIYIGFNVVTPSAGPTNPATPTQGYLVAFNSDGSVKWTYQLIKPSYEPRLLVYFDGSTPVIGSDGTIYFGTTTDNPGGLTRGPVASTSVYAINPNGTLKWVRNNIVPGDATQPPPNGSNAVSITSSLVIGYDNNLYFGCYSSASIIPYQSSSLFSLNSSTGTTNWEYKLSSSPLGIINSQILDSVAIDNTNNIYFVYQVNPSSNSLVYLISLTPNGTFRYICDLNNGNTLNMYLYGRPVLSVNNSSVFVITTFQNFSSSSNQFYGNFYIYSINTQSGTQSLIQNISYTNNIFLPTNNSMARDNEDNLYFSVVNNNNIVIYSIKNNSINWTYIIYGSSLVITLADCTPAIGSDKTIYFGVLATDISSYSNYSVYAINSQGKLKWNKLVSTNASIFATSPVINKQGNVIISVLNGDSITQTASSSLYSFS
jgi:hypothetical protein